MSSKSRRTHSQHAKSESSVRSVRIENLLVVELQSLLRDEASDPSLEGITLLAVHLAPDGGHARVAFAVVGNLEREQALGELTSAGLRRATPFLRARLAEQLQLKKLPLLTFTFVGVTQGGAACE
jgi:ribosome-binding factor A